MKGNFVARLKKMIQSHQEVKKFTEVVVTPAHIERTESPEFRNSKQKLKDDGHYKCWVCGSKENLEAHHFACAWAMANICDLEKLKALCEVLDPYGYGKLLHDTPIQSIDDVRNMMILCEIHHKNPQEGIHMITFPTWILQKICKDGEDPVIGVENTGK